MEQAHADMDSQVADRLRGAKEGLLLRVRTRGRVDVLAKIGANLCDLGDILRGLWVEWVALCEAVTPIRNAMSSRVQASAKHTRDINPCLGVSSLGRRWGKKLRRVLRLLHGVDGVGGDRGHGGLVRWPSGDVEREREARHEVENRAVRAEGTVSMAALAIETWG